MKKEISKILKARAITVAKETVVTGATSEVTGVISFTLATETYGIESLFVREVWPLKDFTPLPGIPSYILGIINVRSQIIAVLDLKKFFNLPEKGLGELNKVIILSNGQMEFGILADDINGSLSVELKDIQAVPPTVTGIGEDYLKGVTGKGLIILNAERLLSDKSIIINSEPD